MHEDRTTSHNEQMNMENLHQGLMISQPSVVLVELSEESRWPATSDELKADIREVIHDLLQCVMDNFT